MDSTDIPLFDVLNRMRVKPDRCLDHMKRLLFLSSKHENCPYLVCLGWVEVLAAYRHCWLEAGEISVDLTAPRRLRFTPTSEYYNRRLIDPNQIIRYTAKELATLTRKYQGFRFFGLESSVSPPVKLTE